MFNVVNENIDFDELGSDGRLSPLFDFFASFGNSFTSVACEVRETGRLDSSDI